MTDHSRTGAVLFASDVHRVAAFYVAALGLDEADRADDHRVLESPGFQLVVHRAVANGAPAAQGEPVRRASAAFKPVYFVPDLARLREVIARHGGIMEPPEREWSFNGVAVCDAVDPEGNVIQFRQQPLQDA
jgi:predicted enzyme related to lactoylglutathione lyase